MAAMRPVAGLLAGLAAELPHPRDGSTGTRLELRHVTREGEDGVKSHEYVPLFVARWLRRPGIGPKAELVALDATADERLARAVLGDDLEVTITTVPSLGTTWQVSDATNSKYRLLRRPEAENNRGRMVELIANMARVFDGSLFGCCTKELRVALKRELEREKEERGRERRQKDAQLTHLLTDTHGNIGAGQVGKLANNLVSLSTVMVVAEGVALAEAGGVDEEDLIKVLQASSGDSWIVRNWEFIRHRWRREHPLGGNGVADMVGKDLRLAVRLGEELRLPLPSTAIASQLVPLLVGRDALFADNTPETGA